MYDKMVWKAGILVIYADFGIIFGYYHTILRKYCRKMGNFGKKVSFSPRAKQNFLEKTGIFDKNIVAGFFK